MKLEVLHVADCPHLPLLLQHLAAAADLPVTTRLIETEAEAAQYGMTGSPTLLIDGVDPFGGQAGSGLSCRITPTPSVDQLATALGIVGARGGTRTRTPKGTGT